ncbi:metalloregulator ArsR/SmtB family transcription factor [Acrocarpospora sp. B8E8]|uniref:ArsR/SmtB family transcription factor n=1 Tax=Acrocarpospora sp. B8E8 TaxID=3153572 RepID=UPI00325F3EE5
MTSNAGTAVRTIDVFKALGDPMRWRIVRRLAEVDELAGGTLEEILPVSKPTISYHMKILVRADLVSVRKEGRDSYYSLRSEILRQFADEMWRLAPEPGLVREGGIDHQAGGTRRRSAAAGERTPQREVILLTW